MLSAVAFGASGLYLLAVPEGLSTVGVEPTRPAGVVELRAFYGGLELGIALFFLVALRRPGWIRPALGVQVLTLGGLAAARALALIFGGGEGLIHLLLLAEATGAAVGLAAMRAIDTSPGPIHPLLPGSGDPARRHARSRGEPNPNLRRSPEVEPPTRREDGASTPGFGPLQ